MKDNGYQEILYYGKQYGHISKLTKRWKKKHLVDKNYMTKCGRKVVTEPGINGSRSYKTGWKNSLYKHYWEGLEAEKCKICFRE